MQGPKMGVQLVQLLITQPTVVAHIPFKQSWYLNPRTKGQIFQMLQMKLYVNLILAVSLVYLQSFRC